VLYGVETDDPTVFGAVAALIALVGVVASWAPARRAAAIDPVRAIRHS
jgi:ABC-type lipoprotein release transport system permease subunit